MDQLSKHKVKVFTKTSRNLVGLSSVYDYPVGFFMEPEPYVRVV